MTHDISPEIPNFLKPLFKIERFGMLFRERSSINKTEMYLVTRLGWYSFNEYLDWFIAKGFIKCKEESGSQMYYLTEKGRKILTIVATLLGIIR